MSIKNIFPYFLLIFGEGILIFAFSYFGNNLETNILTLNIVVASIIYFLFFYDLSTSLGNFGDNSKKKIGGIGIRWFFATLYSVLAIFGIIYFNYQKAVPFTTQLIFQLIIFFVLLIGFFATMSSTRIVQEVYYSEKRAKNGILVMRDSFRKLKISVENNKDFPLAIKAEIKNINEELRFVSPNKSEESINFEEQFVNEVNMLEKLCSESSLNFEKIKESIQKCGIILKYRKEVFSN